MLNPYPLARWSYSGERSRVSQAPSPVVLGVHDLSKNFGGITALNGVSFDIRQGEVCGLIGPNGAGKTTLFDVVSGLQAPTAGTIEILGRNVTNQSPERRARAGVRRTFQRPQLYGYSTVEDNVLCAMEWRGGGGGILADLVSLPSRRRRERERREWVETILESCGLIDLRFRLAGSLPIGQARLVELARALADQCSLVLFDEPTSGLSRRETECLAGHIAGLQEKNVTAVLVEHDMSFVMAHCDRIMVLNLGQVLADGSPDVVQSDPRVREVYLG